MIFENRSLEECTNSLARYHPDGKLFLGKNINSTNYHKFLRGLSEELCRAQDLLITYITEILPDQTTLLIEEYERALGIPDSCLDNTGTVSERRRNILAKLASSGLQTSQDFIDFAKIFGYVNPDPGEITVSQGVSKFEIIITFPVANSPVFPFTFPIPFGSTGQSTVECLLTKLKPANCRITFSVV